MKKERVGDRDADNGDGVSDAQQGGPVFVSEPEEAMKRDDQIAGMPPAHAQGEREENTLKRFEFLPAGDELRSQPERHHGPDAIAYELQDFEWRHGLKRKQLAADREPTADCSPLTAHHFTHLTG